MFGGPPRDGLDEVWRYRRAGGSTLGPRGDRRGNVLNARSVYLYTMTRIGSILAFLIVFVTACSGPEAARPTRVFVSDEAPWSFPIPSGWQVSTNRSEPDPRLRVFWRANRVDLRLWLPLRFQSVEQLTSESLPTRSVGIDFALVRRLATVPARDVSNPDFST
jgi:hypothetical protein